MTSLIERIKYCFPLADLSTLMINPRMDKRQQAAVLIPLVNERTPYILLTKRRDDLQYHPGQYSFPGGAADEGDSDLIATALRETHEEIGILPSYVEVLGSLPARATVSSEYWVTPILGVLSQKPSLQINTDEVDSVLSVPLDYLREAKHYQTVIYKTDRGEIPSITLHFQNAHIWGLTAILLHEFAKYVFEFKPS